jgi:hypothetical protein
MTEPTTRLHDADWIPGACTLPTVEQPLRRREFDDFFASDVLAVVSEAPTRARLDLRPDPDVAARAAALAVAETGCCSFFAFRLAIGAGTVCLEIGTDTEHQDVVAGLTTRVRSRLAVWG